MISTAIMWLAAAAFMVAAVVITACTISAAADFVIDAVDEARMAQVDEDVGG